MDKACREVGCEADLLLTAAARRVLERTGKLSRATLELILAGIDVALGR
jgi:hypothetical protein